MSDEMLRKEIESHNAASMKKVDQADLQKRAEEKKKRAEELEKFKAKLKAEGKWEEEG